VHLIELTAAGNEASDLLRVHDAGLLARLDARAAFWTVLDEGPVEACLALLVQSHGGRWSARHVEADAGDQQGRTEDGEALAWRDGWVYVFGSHFGKKKGPLKSRRAFVARFRESLTPALEISRHGFALHRLINDALAETVGDPSEIVHARFIAETRRRAEAKGKPWADQLVPGDHPINIEGAAFTQDGHLLLGLRWPVTRAGEPMLIELDWDRKPAVRRVHVLRTKQQGPLGVRALSARDDGDLDVIVGSIDALDKGSILLDAYPQARDATCRHFRLTLGQTPRLVRDLAPMHHVEGVSELDGHPLYVTDEDHRIALYHPAPWLPSYPGRKGPGRRSGPGSAPRPARRWST
jgi:hypothetical protein